MGWRDELEELDDAPPALRRFGWVVGGAFLAFGSAALLRHRLTTAAGLALPAVFLLSLAMLRPAALRPVRRLWMGVALVIGGVMSGALLTMLFVLVLTPLGLLARLTGRDFLGRQFLPADVSYWHTRPPTPAGRERHERQF